MVSRHDLRYTEDEESQFISRRHRYATQEGVLPPGVPRLGRRESEPHSSEITYLYDVLTTNFPTDRVMWDLNHYFKRGDETVVSMFDLSYFRNLNIPYDLSSYKAEYFNNRVPDMAVNILSKSTYNQDIGMIVERCKSLKIPVYVVLNPYLPKPSELKAPFVRVYEFDENAGQYKIQELKEVCTHENQMNEIDTTKLLDVKPDLLPFKIGLMEIRRKYEIELPRYRMVLVDRTSGKILLTKAEQEWQRAEMEKQRAEQERQRAEMEKKRADEAEAKLRAVQEELEKLKRKG